MSVPHAQGMWGQDPQNWPPDFTLARCRICRSWSDLVRAGSEFVCRVACWGWKVKTP